MENTVILTCILSSTLAATVITSLKELYLWKLNRKANKEDKKEEKEIDSWDEFREEMRTLIQSRDDLLKKVYILVGSVQKGDRYLLQDRIRNLIFIALSKGYVTYQESKNVQDMWKIYHNELGGNGDLDYLMSKFKELEIRVDVAEDEDIRV